VRYQHVANGSSTTGLIAAAGLPGARSIWADPLNEGPVPGGLTDAELLHVRAGFLADGPAHEAAVAADLSAWRAAVDDQDAYDELVLWFEHDLFDQLNLIQLLTHLGGRPSRTPVPARRSSEGAKAATLICIDRYPGHPHFKGIGELAPADVAALFETRRPITPPQLALAARAWQAFRSPDPRAIEALLQDDTSALPFLAAALARHLEDFPSDTDGLSRTERRLMEAALDGPADLRALWPRLHAGERAHYITDSSLQDLAAGLAGVAPPLLVLSTNGHDSRLPHGTIALTGAGRDVLRGAADRLRLCGIDRWMGGVHLAGKGPAWRWSTRAGRIVEA
jgi:hypothetical protein